MEARSWNRPGSPVLTPPDAFLVRRLQLDDAWLDANGQWRRVVDLDSVELWSILGYLRWHAPALVAMDPGAGVRRGPDDWLASQPLVAAVERELVSRGAVSAGLALASVRALGAAPWELPDAYRRTVRRGRSAG
jgi:hypothetical protein